MDWYDKKTRRNVFRVSLLVVLLVVTCLLYIWYQKGKLAEYQRQNVYLHPKSVDSASSSNMRTAVEREIDSIKKASGGDTPASFYVHVTPSSKPVDSAAVPVALHKKNNADSNHVKDEKSGNALQEPFALFSRTYTITVGKTVPVSVLWTDNDAKVATYKLVTIKVDDIADKKATFTIEDPFNVLLFSQTGYGVNDKIIIKDEKHNINLSVQEVNTGSVVVNLVSHLNEKIVSQLQKAE